MNALRQAFGEIARRHGLSLAENTVDGVERFNFSYAGTRTHIVYVVTPAAARSRASSLPSVRDSETGPKLAIILDDLGNDRAAADALLALRFPLTISVIPHLPLSEFIADEAYRRGDQVILHLPMQAEKPDANSEPIELRVGMNAEQVEAALNGMLETVPHAVGANNHQGSRATSDPALMGELMPALHAHGLFFIDSRTTASTVAYDAAERASVPAASRKVFLDDSTQRAAIIAQARSRGEGRHQQRFRHRNRAPTFRNDCRALRSSAAAAGARYSSGVCVRPGALELAPGIGRESISAQKFSR